ncbi:MAG: vanadium-dependent haloperoxidase [Pseudonocardiaceae bacterium]
MTERLSRRTLLIGIGALAGTGAAGAAGLFLASDGGNATVVGSRVPAPPSHRLVTGPPASSFDGEVAHHWASTYLALVVANGVPPPSAARIFSQLGMVLHAASAAGTPDARPLASRAAGALGAWNPPPLEGDLHWPLVANAALIHLVPRLYPDLSGPVMQAQLVTAQRFADDAQPALRTRCADAGHVLGQALMDWELRVMQADRAQLEPVPTAAPAGPGSWEATPPEYELAVLPQWGHVRTLVLAGGSDVGPGRPPPYSEDPGSPCHTAAQEVVDVVAALSPEQLAAARHWADGEWSITPPGHWLGIATAILRDRGAAFDEAAETYLRLALSQHDAFVSCWWAKYHYNVLRPITYARRVLGRPDWLSPIKTPPFPEYPSGHSVQSAAAAEVMTAQFGGTAFVDRMTESRGLPPRPFTDFRTAAQEAGISRLYGGIHFRPAIERGIEQGTQIGRAIAELPLRG